MFVKNKMTTNPFTIAPDLTIPDAHEIMSRGSVKRLPVVKDGRLVGVVSKEDIAQASPSKATSFSVGELTYLLARTKISGIMNKNVITIAPDALLEEAAILMRSNDISFLPVVDGEKLVGVITKSDIFDAFISLLGFREPGTRLTIEVEDIPGIMASIGGIFAESGANISHVAVYTGASGKSAVVIGTRTLNTEEIEKSIESKGFKIIYKLQNK